jgi:hypothetical protein
MATKKQKPKYRTGMVSIVCVGAGGSGGAGKTPAGPVRRAKDVQPYVSFTPFDGAKLTFSVGTDKKRKRK